MRTATTVNKPPQRRPLMVWDGACTFCRRWILRGKRWTAGSIDYTPYQDLENRFPEIPRQNFNRSVHLISPDGSVLTGAAAVFASLRFGPIQRILYLFYTASPRFAGFAEGTYSFVSRHRGILSAVIQLFVGKNQEVSTYVVSSWLFNRLFGVVALFATLSYGIQAEGLIGSEGILPVTDFLQSVKTRLAASRPDLSPFEVLPTLLWLNSCDAAITAVWIAATLASLCLVAGLVPALAAALLAVCYLSLTIAGQVFLTFQWDILLIEMSYLVILYSNWVWLDRLKRHREPPRVARWLVWFLLFRLMFESGIVKIQSYGVNDTNTWRDLTALDYHYWSQPLPTWTSWFAHHLPNFVHQLSIAGMLVVELVIPFFIIGPRRVRNCALYCLILFQLLILLTGNYGFFNLLTIILCLSLLDDQSLPAYRARRDQGQRPWPQIRFHSAGILHRVLLPTIFASVLLIGSFQVLESCADTRLPPASFRVAVRRHAIAGALLSSSGGFRAVNAYGLFRVMTETRPEIIIEGSRDAVHWEAYEFRYKPGDTARRPPFLLPHMPRLDWRLWFEGLNFERTGRLSPWFQRFLQELLGGNAVVSGLLVHDPFRESPPRHCRIQLYHYTFSDYQTRRETGRWWDRELLDPYTLTFSLRRR